MWLFSNGCWAYAFLGRSFLPKGFGVSLPQD
jgi:hypothetical protein